MSIKFMDHVLAQLRLLARANVVCDAYGRRLSGDIDQRVETLREQLSAIHDRLLDGLSLSAQEEAVAQAAVAVVRHNHKVVAALQREYSI